MKSIRTMFLALSALLAMTGSSYGVVITTTFASNNGNAGNFFDVVTLGGALSVSRLDLNVDPGTFVYDLYMRSGTWVGNNGSSAGWTLVGSTSVVSLAQNTPTAFNVPFTLPGNSITGLYIVGTSINYTNGTAVGNVFASNSDLQILEGAGSGGGFPGSVNTPRVWNGSIVYNLASDPGAPEMDPHSSATPITIMALSLLMFGYRKNRVSLTC